MTLTQYKTHKSAQQKLDKLFADGEDVLFIHYSCESFYDNPNRSSHRITSIAVHSLKHGQTKSFSIHQEAELMNIPTDQIIGDYEKVEKRMLNKFNKFILNNKHHFWIHWNMRDSNYGFEAITHRSQVLKVCKLKEIPDDRKYDLSKILYELLGPDYIENPKLETILVKNNMKPKDFLNGKAEAEAFENGEYIKLHQSTLTKVVAMKHLAKYATAGKLKCNNNYFKKKGFTLSTASAGIKNHPLYALICIIIALVTLISDATQWWPFR